MALVTIADLERVPIYNSLTKSEASTSLKRLTEDSLGKKFDIFLSHSYLDSRHIAALKQDIEEKTGCSVYVDWIEDSELDRSKVNRATADRLRRRLRNCSSLLFAVSLNSPKSLWMPWELGWYDGFNGRVALLPVATQTEIGFKGTEYLELYPYVDKAKVQDKDEHAYWVQEQGGEKNAVTLKRWLNAEDFKAVLKG